MASGLVVKNQQLLLFNSFEYSTAEDFIYYLLFTCEQLQLSPETIAVYLLGLIDENSEYFKMAYKFIRNCNLLETDKWASMLDKNEAEVRKNFILFHS